MEERHFPLIARILFFIAFVAFLILTFREAGINGLPSWLLGAGLTSLALGMVAA